MSWEVWAMTTRTFFDKGVYKSTLKRFSLGSVLYFIMLFVCTSMVILLVLEPKSYNADMAINWDYNLHGLILREDFIFPSAMIALFVPTVVSLLVYRFVHSKKNSIFLHSLPVTKTANYISTLAGAFTLMAIPVILNAVVLSVISICGYGYYFHPADTVIWALFNLLILFIMFSISTFASMCTGNSFALVVINAILIFAPLLIASITETILAELLYGYSYKRNLLHFAAEINPVNFLMEFAEQITSWDGLNFREGFSFVKPGAFLLMAVVLYVLSGILYKLRHAETSEDVAGFKILNPIFKYFITFVGTLSVFSLFSQFMAEKKVLFTFVVILASVILYFGSEMILKKTVKVWNSYKGYLAFGGVFTVFILFLGLTGVFGYETYVPEIEDIEEAAIYNYYYQPKEPFTSNETLNKYIIEVHNDFVEKENRSILNHDAYHDTSIRITYKLKNGKEVARRYGVSYKKNDEIMSEVYNYPEYKEACEAVFNKNIKHVESISVNFHQIAEDSENLAELLECIKADVKTLDYDKLRLGSGVWCAIRYGVEEETETSEFDKPYSDVYYDWIEVRINKYYENTIKWLKDNGYEYVFTDSAWITTN